MAEGSLSGIASAPTLVVPSYTFRDPIADERRGYLVEIEPSSEASILVLQHSGLIRGPVVWLYYVPIGGPPGGKPVQTTTDPTAAFFATNRTSWYISSYYWPAYLVFLDETGTERYVTYDNDATGNLVASATVPSGLMLRQGQYVGDYVEFLGGDGVSLYHMTVNSSNVITTALDRVEPDRIKPVCLGQGVPPAMRDDSTETSRIWLESVIDVADVEMRLDETEWGYGGTFVPRTGNVTVSLATGSGDGTFDLDWLATQRWNTRSITVNSGSTTDSLDNWPIVYRGQTNQAEFDENILHISMQDYGIFFDRPVQTNTYAGTGLQEGTSELRGTPKPLAFGECQVITPVLVDPLNWIYQVHDGRTGPIHWVWDKGIPLQTTGDMTQPAFQFENLWQWQPPPQFAGQYLEDRGRGMFRLAAPPEGQVTARVISDRIVLPFTATIGGIIQAIAVRSMPEIPHAHGAFDMFRWLVPDAAQMYITQERTIRDVFHELISPIGFVGINRFGQLTARLLSQEGPAKLRITDDIIAEDTDIRRRQAPPPAGHYRFGFDQINTVQTATDLAAGATQSYRSRVSQEYRYVPFNWAQPYLRNESSKSITIESAFLPLQSAQYWLNFVVGRHQTFRHVYDLAIVGHQFEIELGDTVVLHLQRWDLNSPKTGLVVGVHEQVNSGLTHLTIWI